MTSKAAIGEVVLLTVGVLLWPAMARAQTTPPVPDRIGLGLHTEVGLTFPVGGGGGERTPAMAAVGLGVGYEVARRVEVELTLSRVLPGSRAVLGPAGTTEIFETRVGMLWRGLVHYHFADIGPGWVVGAGPALVTSGNFGTVPLFHVEGGYEWRTRFGLHVLGAFQIIEPLAVSQVEVAPSRCITGDCPSRFDPRQPVLGWRGSLGIVF